MPKWSLWASYVALILCCLIIPSSAWGDADEQPAPGTNPLGSGLQPLSVPVPVATTVPGESRLVRREDGTFAAVPERNGRTKTFFINARRTPWALSSGLIVMASTYDGVVPGPTLVVNQGDHVVINYHNMLPIADTIHLHGIHGIGVDMDGVAGISQAAVATGGTFKYEFTAGEPGTFIYHTHGPKALLDSGLYGAIIVQPAHPRPEERVQRDDVEMLSSWSIQSAAPNHFTINGREYPGTTPIEVTKGDRVRIRWINISSEDIHTMHTHGHYQRIIARDAQPVTDRDVQDTVLIAPGQRVDVVLKADQQPGNWLVHCHVLDHIEDGAGMPAGLITTIHYAGVKNELPAMGAAMAGVMTQAANAMQQMGAPTHRPPLSFFWTTVLGAIAGLTIILGLPVARVRRISPRLMVALNALAVGILVYLVVEILGNAAAPIAQAVHDWRLGAPFWPTLERGALFVVGLLVGLVGLGWLSGKSSRAAAAEDEPLVLAGVVALGIGAHNFSEGLAIGASAASGATAVALSLIIGFGLHNATEGFAIAAPMAGRIRPGWGMLLRLALIAGGPTTLGTMIGYVFNSPELNVIFLTVAVGALVYVIGELWGILKRMGFMVLSTAMLAFGIVIAFATELFLDAGAM